MEVVILKDSAQIGCVAADAIESLQRRVAMLDSRTHGSIHIGGRP